MSYLEAYLKDLAEIVNFDSGSHNTAGVTHAAEIMKRHFDSIGFTTKLVDLGPQVGKGLLATNKPDAKVYDIMFNAHLDTVFPDGEAAKRPMSQVGDHIMGPGCVDCKSGVMSIFYAIKNARKEDLDRLAIVVAYNPDEETGSVYSHEWLGSIAKQCKRALVCEAARPNGELVRSRKGTGTWIVKFHGKSAHAGNNPKDGHSAVLAAAKFTVEVSKLQDLDGKGISVNVGLINGGTASNVIPAECTLKIDTRRWNEEDGRYVDEAIKALAAQNWGEGITVEAVRESSLPAMPYNESTKELAGLLTQAAKEVGFETTWVDAGGGSDANHIALLGTPVIDGVGPAGGAFHCDKEYLRIDTIEERTDMMTKFLSLI